MPEKTVEEKAISPLKRHKLVRFSAIALESYWLRVDYMESRDSENIVPVHYSFDGTLKEFEEWAETPDGIEALKEFVSHYPVLIRLRDGGLLNVRPRSSSIGEHMTHCMSCEHLSYCNSWVIRRDKHSSCRQN